MAFWSSAPWGPLPCLNLLSLGGGKYCVCDCFGAILEPIAVAVHPRDCNTQEQEKFASAHPHSPLGFRISECFVMSSFLLITSLARLTLHWFFPISAFDHSGLEKSREMATLCDQVGYSTAARFLLNDSTTHKNTLLPTGRYSRGVTWSLGSGRAHRCLIIRYDEPGLCSVSFRLHDNSAYIAILQMMNLRLKEVKFSLEEKKHNWSNHIVMKIGSRPNLGTCLSYSKGSEKEARWPIGAYSLAQVPRLF